MINSSFTKNVKWNYNNIASFRFGDSATGYVRELAKFQFLSLYGFFLSETCSLTCFEKKVSFFAWLPVSSKEKKSSVIESCVAIEK